MTPEGIITKVRDVLAADATLSVNVRKFFLGARSDVKIQDFPCIIIEVDSNRESDELDTNVLQRLTLKLMISAYVRVLDADKQIIGDATHKGTMDIEKDIKVALGAVYPNMSGNSIWFKFINTITDISQWPVRGITIEADFYYQQNYLTRT